MALIIREAVLQDADSIVEFNRRLAQETEGKVLDLALLVPGVFAALRDRERGRYFVAESDGQVVAQLMLTREWSDWRNGWFWWIQSVYVREDWRHQGVFRSLYRHVEAAARHDPEVIGLRLYVEKENHAARRTYARLGLEQTGYLLLERYPLDRPVDLTE
jgi:GNAT superfamily N-acetyltransferase